MKLPEIAVRRPVATIMVFAAIVLLGCLAFFKLKLDMLPDIEPPAVSVITPYPGLRSRLQKKALSSFPGRTVISMTSSVNNTNGPSAQTTA